MLKKFILIVSILGCSSALMTSVEAGLFDDEKQGTTDRHKKRRTRSETKLIESESTLVSFTSISTEENSFLAENLYKNGKTKSLPKPNFPKDQPFQTLIKKMKRK